MACNQVPVAEKARIISENFVVPMDDVERIHRKELNNCTPLEAYIKQGNIHIPFDMVREIQKKEVADCSVLELKIRYNNPELGKLPEWVDYDTVQNIIEREVSVSWTGELEPIHSKEDIQYACWEHLLLKSKEISGVPKEDYEKYVCHLVKWHISNFYYYKKVHNKHENFKFKVSTDGEVVSKKENKNISRLPEVYYNWNETDAEIREETKSIFMYDNNRNEREENRILDQLEEEMDILNLVKSIKDTTTRDLVSIAAFVLAQMDSFEDLYNEAIERMTEAKKKEFTDMIKEGNPKNMTFKKILKLLVGKEANTYFSKIDDYMHKIILKSGNLAEI